MSTRTPKAVSFDEKELKEIVDLREQGKKWVEISDIMGIPSGKLMLMHDYATVKPKDRVKNATGADIANLRDKLSLSWGAISARTGYPEGSCRSLYEEHTGNSTKGNRIGKGGRYSKGEAAPAKAEKPTKKAAKATPGTTKKSAPGAVASKRKPVDFPDQTLEAVSTKIKKRAIKVASGAGEPEVIRVKAVKKVAKGAVVLTDHEGKSRTIKLATIVEVSKGTVL